jgi:hypothetical protein
MTDGVHPKTESPIVIGGLGRCGSTFLQNLLSSHPLVHIYGQFPPAQIIDVVGFMRFQQRLVEAGKWSEAANETPICDWPHYAGSDEKRTRELIRHFVRDWFCGFPVSTKTHWGLKALSLAYHEPYRDVWESWFPETRYIICVRDPFDSYQSAKNTVNPKAVLDDWLHRFVHLIQRHCASNYSRLFHLAGIDVAERDIAIADLLDFLDLPPDESMNCIVNAWPTVHKRKSDAERDFKVANQQREQAMGRIDGLSEAMTVLDNSR